MSGVLKIIATEKGFELHDEKGLVDKASPLLQNSDILDPRSVIHNLEVLTGKAGQLKDISFKGIAIQFHQAGHCTQLRVQTYAKGNTMPVLNISIDDGLPELPGTLASSLCATIKPAKVSPAPRRGVRRKLAGPGR